MVLYHGIHADISTKILQFERETIEFITPEFELMPIVLKVPLYINFLYYYVQLFTGCVPLGDNVLYLIYLWKSR